MDTTEEIGGPLLFRSGFYQVTAEFWKSPGGLSGGEW
jgi:hypothetical protein